MTAYIIGSDRRIPVSVLDDRAVVHILPGRDIIVRVAVGEPVREDLVHDGALRPVRHFKPGGKIPRAGTILPHRVDNLVPLAFTGSISLIAACTGKPPPGKYVFLPCSLKNEPVQKRSVRGRQDRLKEIKYGILSQTRLGCPAHANTLRFSLSLRALRVLRLRLSLCGLL